MRKQRARPSESSVRKEERCRKIQISGFLSCLNAWFDDEFGKTLSPFKLQTLQDWLKNVPLEELVKTFKGLLTWNFSFYMDQPLPEVPLVSQVSISNLMSSSGKSRFHTRVFPSDNCPRFTRKVRFLWSLLQCKTLAAEVPETFVSETLTKHSTVMAKQPMAPNDDILDSLRDFVRGWCKQARSLFREKTIYPTSHSCYEYSRSSGGTREFWKENLTPVRTLQHDGVRREPIVIHLEGPPGIGKSRMVRQLCEKIGRRFGRLGDFHQWTYYRSAGVEHWDGYENQLITVIDDFGFEKFDHKEPTVSRQEIIQLVSECDYIVPMAHLKDKGRKFTSPFLILTSNLGATGSCSANGFQDKKAYLRRLDPTWVMADEQDLLSVNGKPLFRKKYKKPVIWKYDLIDESGSGFNGSSAMYDHQWLPSSRRSFNSSQIVEWATQKYLTYTTSEDGDHVSQVILDPSVVHAGLQISTTIPEDLPPNVVKVHPIPEPLKVRVITKPQGLSFLLKPVQLALFEALRQYPEFLPCFDPNYNIPFSSEEGKVFVSGDYTNATDDLNFFVSQVVVDEIANAFSDLPHYERLIRWEGGSHICEYPHKSQIPSVIQTNGQLMGSLLSFPILCMVNAFTIAKSTGKPLGELPALFHGDDVAAQLSPEEFSTWSEFAPSIGLSLSVGKNYTSKSWVSIDSQLYMINRENVWTKQRTGKFSLLKMDEEGLNARFALERGFSKDLIRRYGMGALKGTSKSLDVSVEHGGLGLETTRPLTSFEKAMYFTTLATKARVQDAGCGLVRVPKELAKFLQLDDMSLPIEDKPVSERTLFRKAHRLLAKLNTSRQLRQKFAAFDIKTARPLTTIKKVTTHCAGHSLAVLENLSNSIIIGTSKTNAPRKSPTSCLKTLRTDTVQPYFAVKSKSFKYLQSGSRLNRSPLSYQQRDMDY